MTRFKTYLVSFLLLMVVTSCSTTVEEDLEEYCNCVGNVESGFEMGECIGLAQGMMDKYSSDPEAAKYIEENIKKCGSPGE